MWHRQTADEINPTIKTYSTVDLSTSGGDYYYLGGELVVWCVALNIFGTQHCASGRFAVYLI